jgi:glycosyltransferase involved in cell wall biosynthesis
MATTRKLLQITSYPPPRAGWGVRVQFLKRQLEREGNVCTVLNIGSSRAIPSDEYETVLGGWDYVRKVWRFSRQGYVAHVHVNGASPKGFVLAIAAELINLVWGRRCFLTFHAGVEQVYFPRPKYPLLLPMYWVLFTIPRAIICNSDEVKAKIVEYGVSGQKVFPIPAFSKQYLESMEDALPTGIADFYGRFREIVFCYTKIRPLFFPEVLIEGFALIATRRADVGLVLCGVAGHQEPGLWQVVQDKIDEHGLRDRILIVDDLPHELFLTALARSALYLRTHVSDGVCSSVLEALALGVPVVANENRHRPPGVKTFPPEDADLLATTVIDVLTRREAIIAELERPEVRDTVADEVKLLTA